MKRLDRSAFVTSLVWIGAASVPASVVAQQGDTTWIETARLQPEVLQDEFAWSVGIDGDTLVAGDPNPSQSSGGDFKGSATVFEREGDGWVQKATLKANDGALLDNFGYAVAVSGNVIVVGAWADDDGGNAAGSAYVWERAGGTWTFAKKLNPHDPIDLMRFGRAVAVDGDTIVVGAHEANGAEARTGAAYVYRRAAGTWTAEAKLRAEDGHTWDLLGDSVSIDGDTVIAGAPGLDTAGAEAGGAVVFVRDGTSWSQQAVLLATDAKPHSWGGRGVGVSGDVAAFGAPVYPIGGAVHLFERDAGSWSQVTTIFPESDPKSGRFGEDLALDGDLLLTGSFYEGLPTWGSAYVIGREAGAWGIAQRLFASDAHYGNHFGISVALDGESLAVGATGLDPGDISWLDPGTAYVFERVPFPGEAFCFGDGSGTPCPCGNTGGPGEGCRNGSGRGAELSGVGTNSFSADDLVLAVFHMPPAMPGMIFAGTKAIAGGLGAPFHDGLRCAGGPVLRGPPFVSDASGYTELTGPVAAIGGGSGWIEPGRTVHFQAYFRDFFTSPCGRRANLSNGYSVTYGP